MCSLSGTLATMANGLPYTIAAQVAHPDRQCVAFVGDGGFSMLMAEFLTAVKYDLPIKVVVIKNNTLGQIKWEQMVFLGNPEFAPDAYRVGYTSMVTPTTIYPFPGSSSGSSAPSPVNVTTTSSTVPGSAVSATTVP